MNSKRRTKSKELKITALPSSPPDPRLAEIVLPILLEGFGSQKRQSDSGYHAEHVIEQNPNKKSITSFEGSKKNYTPLVVTYAEAGKMLLNISERTIRRMVNNGDLPYVKVRGRVGIPYDALLEYVKSQTRYAESEQHREQCLSADQIASSGRSRAPITPADRLAEVVKQAISKKQKR